MATVPPATDPLPWTRKGRPVPSIRTPRPRSASSSGAMGRARACSSPSKVHRPSASAASGGTKRKTVPARPQSTRASASGAIRPLTVSSVPVPVDAQAQSAQRSDHQVGIPAAQRSADGRGALALRGRQCGQHQRAVGL